MPEPIRRFVNGANIAEDNLLWLYRPIMLGLLGFLALQAWKGGEQLQQVIATQHHLNARLDRQDHRLQALDGRMRALEFGSQRRHDERNPQRVPPGL